MQSILARNEPRGQVRNPPTGALEAQDTALACNNSGLKQCPTEPGLESVHPPGTLPRKDLEDSSFGVQSLEEVIQATETGSVQGDGTLTSRAAASELLRHEVSDRMSPEGSQPSASFRSSLDSSRVPNHLRLASLNSISLPLTPVGTASPGTESAPPSTPKSVGSLKSFRLSDDDSADEASSQAVASTSEDEEYRPVDGSMTANNDHQDTPSRDAPQFIMPSIKMPPRRPFTEKGKSIGKLKIMIVGAKNTGKTSLIKSMVQQCKDIIHIDPKSLGVSEDLLSPSQVTRREVVSSWQAQNISEIYASTRAHPFWWNEGEERGRRKSATEPVLDRNICFVDTPGFDSSSYSRQSSSILKHIESLLHRNASLSELSEEELLSIYSGNGGVQVDLAVFVLEGTRARFKRVLVCFLEDSVY